MFDALMDLWVSRSLLEAGRGRTADSLVHIWLAQTFPKDCLYKATGKHVIGQRPKGRLREAVMVTAECVVDGTTADTRAFATLSPTRQHVAPKGGSDPGLRM